MLIFKYLGKFWKFGVGKIPLAIAHNRITGHVFSNLHGVPFSRRFKAMGACGPCHWTPSVGHLAGADARSSINCGPVGSDENPENREPLWKTMKNQQFAPEKNMFFGICWRMFFNDVFSFWIRSLSNRGQFGFGVKLYCPISSGSSKQDVHPNGGPTQIDRLVMVVKLILWGRS